MNIRKQDAMKRSWVVLSMLSAIMGVAHAQEEQSGLAGSIERMHPCGESKIHALQSYFKEGHFPPPAQTDTDLRHYKLEIEVIPSTSKVQGTSTVTMDSTVNGLTSVQLNLDGNSGLMTVSSVGGAAVSSSLSGDVLTLTLNRAYNKGEQFNVIVNYGGTPRNTGYGSFIFGSHGTGANAGSVVSSLSEPFFARTWWPCKDVLGDKADNAEVWITCPSTLTGVSNGVLVGTDALSGSRTRYRWTESYPIVTYLVSIAVSNYALYSLTYNHLGNTMPMSYYLFPEHNGTNSTSQVGCNTNKTQVEKLSDVFGQYPFVNEKYGMAEVVGAGAYMEHQTCSSMLGVTGEAVNSHELSHQWWGDMVTCGSWADIWLNEGFATYGEAIWQEQKNNGSYTSYITYMKGSNAVTSPDAQVLRTDLTNVNSIFSGTVYYKGAWVLHMLRGVIGYETLKTTLANYRNDFLYKSAVTSDFAGEASRAWGRDLTFFFNEWINSPGSPDYQYNWRDDTVNGSHRLRLGLWQNQGTRGFGLITMPVKFRVVTTGGTVDISLWDDALIKAYDVALPGAVTSVTFDPDSWILIHSQAKVATAIPTLPLLGDMNADGHVTRADLPILKNARNGKITSQAIIDRGDFNYNGIVDDSDIAAFLAIMEKSSTGPTP